MNTLLIFKDTEEPESIYGCLVVDKDRLPEALEIARLAYNDWANKRICSSVFETISKALEQAGVSSKRIEVGYS